MRRNPIYSWTAWLTKLLILGEAQTSVIQEACDIDCHSWHLLGKMKKKDVVRMAVFLPLSGWCHHHHHPDVTWVAVTSSCISMILFESFGLEPLSFKSFSRPTCCSPKTVFFQNGGSTRRNAICLCRVCVREGHPGEDAVR